ncbi:hypothetical protein B5C34_09295 [Pacificimonas flava]|uniref:BPP domain-containing protein n=2 Tax=Pacificimonas TaxID=1960290 RepID=A0A219B695_9SPHN|nr:MULTISPECIES: phytase [Pacificimonas]MBZ6379135.1 phytase [Pacificimonas aurantium]OWV33636.1 hypothetical protein B5C34_09295 [Pacificimonas flava]
MRFSLLLPLSLMACATVPDAPGALVPAVAETQPVATRNDDAADDPAIWRNDEKPTESLIVGTDKNLGLYVYNLDGEELSFSPAPALNNTALVELADGTILVGASDREQPQRPQAQFYRLDPQTGQLTPLGAAAVGTGEAYGFCMALRGGGAFAYLGTKEGSFYEIALRADAFEPTGRSYSVETQPEGCVVDPRTDTLYVGEEIRGIWSFDLKGAPAPGSLLASVAPAELVADVEGLALAPQGDTGGYLIASSQGDNRYAVYELPSGAFAGRFGIGGGALDSTEETDGIDLVLGGFGPDYPDGLFVAQDGITGTGQQNFKFASWADIKAALSLD